MIENPHYDDISANKGPKGDPGPAGTLTTPTADVSFGNHRITNLGVATDGGDAVNKNYVDSRYLWPNPNVDLRGRSITNIDAPTNPADAATKAYVDSGFHQRNADINMLGKRITDINDPANSSDAATKNYVDRHNPIIKRTYAINKSLSKSNITFPHTFPRGEIYYIWFSLLYSSDSYPRIVFHPYGPGFRQDVVGQVDSTDYIIYSYDVTNISIRRGGNNSTTLKEIGIIYVPNI